MKFSIMFFKASFSSINFLAIAKLILCFVLCNVIYADAQNGMIDSLQKVLSVSKDDTNKLGVLNTLIENIDDNTVWQPYNEQMGKLALSLLNNKNAAIQLTAKKYYAFYFNNAGYFANEKGNIPQALDNYYKSLNLCEVIKDKKGMADVLNNIGVIKDRQDDKQGALELYLRSSQLYGEVGDKTNAGNVYNNIGTIYNTLGIIDSAFLYFERTLRICTETGDKNTMAMALSNIGGIYDNKLNDLAKAMDYYGQSLKIQQEIGNMQGIYTSQINFGSIYLKRKNFKKAETEFQSSMRIARETGYVENIKGAANWLIKVYSAEGKYKEAFEMLTLYKQMSDSILNEKTRKQTVQKEYQYEFDKKEAVLKVVQEKKDVIAKEEIEKQKQTRNAVIGGSIGFAALSVLGFFLYRSNRIKKENELKRHAAEVDMKALRSQMNPHFIFNSLNSIQNFINSNDSENANEYLVKFAKLVRMILENSRKQEVELSEDLKALELYMQLESLRLKCGFDYEIKIDDAIEPDNVLVPPLIVQPFVENAIWHGLQYKKERGKITIAFSRMNNELVCIVEDNGVGREAATVAKQKTMPEKKQSLGMQITKERINLYNNLKNTNAFFEIVDINHIENNNSGVRVLLHLPFEEAI
ncbi:MAG: tetratricopeptide repeat protein [Bacteroidia bacterium]